MASPDFPCGRPSGVGTGIGTRLPMIKATATQRSGTFNPVLRSAILIRLSSGMPWNWERDDKYFTASPLTRSGTCFCA